MATTSANLQGLLQSTCSALGFEVGEIWFASKGEGLKRFLSCYLLIYMTEEKYALRFHQLYINSIFEEFQRVLIRPNVAEGLYNDELNHTLSPTVSMSVISLKCELNMEITF